MGIESPLDPVSSGKALDPFIQILFQEQNPFPIMLRRYGEGDLSTLGDGIIDRPGTQREIFTRNFDGHEPWPSPPIILYLFHSTTPKVRTPCFDVCLQSLLSLSLLGKESILEKSSTVQKTIHLALNLPRSGPVFTFSKYTGLTDQGVGPVCFFNTGLTRLMSLQTLSYQRLLHGPGFVTLVLVRPSIKISSFFQRAGPTLDPFAKSLSNLDFPIFLSPSWSSVSF